MNYNSTAMSGRAGRNFFKAVIGALKRLIAAWTGCDANDTRMILHTHALIGEILAFRLGKETILLRTGWTAFDEEKTELINQTVTCHIDLILQGLSQRSL